MKTVIKWVGNILTVILIVIVACSVMLVYQSRTAPGKVPSVMGFKPLTVLSGSMSPSLLPGDMIVARYIDPGSIEAGDVITYRVDERTLVTHRVVEVVRENGLLAFRTRGDANNTDDPELVPADKVIGSMVFKIPYAGYVGRFVRTPVGFIALILLPALLLMALEGKNVLSELSQKEDKERKGGDGIKT